MCVSTLESASSSTRIRGIANQGAGYGCALFLAAGERDAALADQCSVLIGKLSISVAMLAASAAQRTSSSLAFCDAEGDVLANGFAEQKSFLRHEADIAAQVGERIFANRLAVDQHRTGRSVVNARDQSYQRRLSRTGGSDDCETGASGNSQIDVMQDRSSVVREIQVAEFDVAAQFAAGFSRPRPARP